MNKTTFILLFTLLTTQHNQIKSGCIINFIGAAAFTVAAVYVYVQYQESKKNDLEKAIDKTGSFLKDNINKIQDIFKDKK
jgi:hypothetical protein